jgi:Family of unknown function (DUF6526)
MQAMQPQHYSNHKKYYIPHHFIFIPLMMVCIIVGVKNSLHGGIHQTAWMLFSVSSFCILYLGIMLRQHYALGNQDRLVRLEFRLRYFELLGASANEVENQLSFDQIAALRFAHDLEFKMLLQRAIHEKLSANDIKKAITDWKPDMMRL